jgi:8-oxo-dGTP diphosphatase
MPTSDRPICGVGAAILDDGRLLLVKRGKPPNEGLWAVPGGKVTWGETMPDAVRREIKEETSLDINVGGVVWVGESIGPGEPAEWHYCLVDFDAVVIAGQARAATDAADLGWFTLVEARKLPLTSTMPALLEALEQEGAFAIPPRSASGRTIPPPGGEQRS